MSAQDNLSPQQFYHGSPHYFRPGQVINPAKPHDSNFKASDNTRLYMDTTFSKAQEFGAMQDEVGHGYSVYTVQPLGKVQPDRHRNDPDYNPEDHDTAFETPDKVRVLQRHKLTDEELYGQ